MFMRIIALFKDISRSIYKIKYNRQFKKATDDYYLNIESFKEAIDELGILYGLRSPILEKKVLDNKELSKKEEEKLELIEHRIQLLFSSHPGLKRLK